MLCENCNKRSVPIGHSTRSDICGRLHICTECYKDIKYRAIAAKRHGVRIHKKKFTAANKVEIVTLSKKLEAYVKEAETLMKRVTHLAAGAGIRIREVTLIVERVEVLNQTLADLHTTLEGKEARLKIRVRNLAERIRVL